MHLPGALKFPVQSKLVQQARDLARTVQGSALAMRKPRLKSGEMKVHMLSLGRHWEYGSQQYVRSWGGVAVPQVPQHWTQLAHHLLAQAGALDESLAAWAEHYRVEAALVNYYPDDASMGMHQDAFEDSNAPVISLSIGDEAIFRAGNNETRTKPYEDLRLMSGDVVIFGGPSRAMFHGVPKLFPCTAPSGCGLSAGRINITFRQVEV
ncbi:Alpha-ketoglutarate-dependent dioxygenase AlkB [Corynebacterium gerontici]|uniref:Alpha-ketoglutarate-dependent dioxygenase AlkB n=1 Tax=Corynebacterium gerontici TaxID=2079234 RepID=A0A3G6IXW4_9CORY|nr:Alpha-ketoglutarate-dependent dioxygenase AlkB [Corynebacterium gerontici]